MTTLYNDGNGNWTGSPPNMVNVTNGGASTLGSLAPHPNVPSDPYSIFNNRLADMLQNATNQSISNNKLLGGAKDTLTSLSVAPGGVKSFDPSIFSGSQVQGQETLRAGFQPAITSISTQMANTAAATEGIKSTIGALQESTQPIILQPGQSLVSRDGTVLREGHSYTPQINPLTGLMDGFDQVKGTWASQDSGSSPLSSPPSSNSDLVAGIDFSGAATSTKPYATDPNYASEVENMYTQIQRSSPIPTAQSIDQFIQSHVGGKGNVSGQMIMSAAAQYQIDPNALAAVLGHESGFGTAGAGAKTMNPGNVGNTGTSTRNYNSWQAGVNAAAYELARRMPGNKNAVKINTASTQTATSPVGGQFSPQATQKLGQLPQSMQQYADAGPLGVAFINADKVPDALKQSVQTLSARAGIPYVQAADAGAVKSIQTVLNNLDSMQTLAKNNLASGVWGHAKDSILGALNQWTQTEWGRNLGLFDNYRDTAIKAVQALAGGAGSGLRINAGEIMANVQNLPKSSDNLENATAQIQQLRQLIYTQMATSFPYAMAKVVSSSGAVGKMPIGSLSAAIQAGYKVY